MSSAVRTALGSLVAALVAFAAACGGSTSDAGGSQGGPSRGTDGGTESGASAPSLDASIDASAEVGASDAGDAASPYPAPHPPLPMLKSFGGPVMTDVKITTVSFVGDANRDAFRTFDDAIVTSAWWKTVLGEWGIHAGTSGGYVELPDTVSNTTIDNDTQLIPMLQDLVSKGTLPPPDANTLYALYFPQSTTITILNISSCNGFGAYHDYAPFMPKDADAGNTVYGAYAVMPNCGGFSTGAASHEFIEAATDPHPYTTPTPPTPYSWYAYNDAWFGPGGGEVADLCEGAGGVKSGAYTVARGWSNAAAMASKDPCVPSDPTRVFFGAAFATDTVTGLHDPSNGPDYASEGFIVMKAGTSRDVDLSVFSEAKLPNDLTLSALGWSRKAWSTSPTIATGVTATLSQMTAKNGDHVKLTITVDSSATPGDYGFVVMATLNANDARPWYGILRIE